MPFENGNNWWEARSSHGRKPLYDSPEKLLDACYQYFKWLDENPLYEAKAFAFQGESWIENVPKRRVPLITALCRFIDVSYSRWNEWGADPDHGFSAIVKEVNQMVRDQKFEGAASDFFNANIIARDLGLAEKNDHSSTDGTMTPKGTQVITEGDVKSIIDKI